MPFHVTEEQNPRPLPCKSQETHNPEAVLPRLHGVIKWAKVTVWFSLKPRFWEISEARMKGEIFASPLIEEKSFQRVHMMKV